jgi:hypothetical protein
MFADPRTSPVGIIQAIGRALRPHQDKTVGTIVIPLVLQADGDDQEQLADSAYATSGECCAAFGLTTHVLRSMWTEHESVSEKAPPALTIFPG